VQFTEQNVKQFYDETTTFTRSIKKERPPNGCTLFSSKVKSNKVRIGLIGFLFDV